MTRARYIELKKAEKKAHAVLVQVTKLDARKVMLKGYARMERVLISLPRVPLNEDNKKRLLSAYARSAVKVGLTSVLDTGIEKAIKIAIKPVLAYTTGCFSDAGIDKDIAPAFATLERRLKRRLKVSNFQPVQVFRNRTGYDLSPAIWDAVDGFSDRILAIIEAELAAGTDPVKIARMLEEYIAAGTPEKILGRWGHLEIGSPEYRQRLGTSGADYRTQRVVRTELYHAIRTADIESGSMNPATTGMFNWMLSPSHIDGGCHCADWAASGPYTKDEISDLRNQAHPNCFCLIEPVLIPHDEFMKKLRDYASGKGSSDIEAWMTDNQVA